MVARLAAAGVVTFAELLELIRAQRLRWSENHGYVLTDG
ncbi:hypothetical protein [Burkholderia cepacia]